MATSNSSNQGQTGLFAAPESDNAPAWVTAHTDGGSRGNPGPAGYGVAFTAANGAPLAELSEFIGIKSNNVAEYAALLAALDWALANGHRRLRVVSDSELMVKQVQGRYKVSSPDLRPMFEQARRQIAKLEGFEITHALRHKNKNADRLANLAMDRGGRARSSISKATPYPKADKVLRGVVKNGVVELLGGALPEGAFVKVERE